MSQLYSLDSNIFVRFLIHDNEQMFAECKKLFRTIVQDQDNEYWVDLQVLSEVIFVLTKVYEVPQVDAITTLDELIAAFGIRIKDTKGQNVFAKASRLFRESGVKFSDCLIAANLRPGETVITYDLGHFQRLAAPCCSSASLNVPDRSSS
jgi:predicted nucleic-acid-binding protein